MSSKKNNTTNTPAQETPVVSPIETPAVVETPATEPVQVVSTEVPDNTPPVEEPVVDASSILEPVIAVSPVVPNSPEMATIVFSGQHVETVKVPVRTKLKDIKLSGGATVGSMMLRNAKGHMLSEEKEVEAGSMEVFTYAKAKRG
jgi:hypothetical protein